MLRATSNVIAGTWSCKKNDPLHYRLLKSFMRGSFEGSLNAPKMKIADAEGIRKVTEQFVRKPMKATLRSSDGRGLLLQNCKNAFHTEGKSQAEAIELVENIDLARTMFIKEDFGIDWLSRQFFT